MLPFNMIRRRSYLKRVALGVTGGVAVAGTKKAEIPSLVQSAQAQSRDSGWEQTATLPLERRQEDTVFGQDITYEGEKALISENDVARVYTKASDETWRRETELTAESDYGPLVEWMDGAALVSGGPETLYVFEEQGQEWQRTAELAAGDSIGTNQEHSVATAGEQAVLGAAGALNADDVPTGAAYVYGRDDDNWTLETTLRPDDLGESDAFGVAAAGAEDLLLIGAARQDSSDGEFAGAVYVFTEQNGEWQQSRKLVADDAGAHDIFGFDISLGNDMAAIGAPYASTSDGGRSGAAYLFEHTGSDWAQISKLAADESEQGDNFGTTVALSGDVLIAGAPNRPGPDGEEVGAAYAFHHNDDWEQMVKLLADDSNERDRFGASVAVDGREAIIGAPQKEPVDQDVRSTGAGKAYVFEGGDAAAPTEQSGTATSTVRTTPPEEGQAKEKNTGLPWEILAGLGGLSVIGYLLKRRQDGDS